MRRVVKYKIFYQSKKVINFFPSRLNVFNRTKWKKFRLKNRLQLKFKIVKLNFNLIKKYNSIRNIKLNLKLIKRNKFKNFFFPKINRIKKIKLKVRKHFKNSLLTKKLLLQNFNCNLNSFNLRKDVIKKTNLLYTNLVQKLLIKNNFKLVILLWKLNFFSSTFESRQFIDSNLVYVNNEIVDSNYFLKKGDIISFRKNLFSFKFSKILKSIQMSYIFSFVEIDYYTCNIIIIKNFNELNLNDFSLITSNLINIANIYNQFLKYPNV